MKVLYDLNVTTTEEKLGSQWMVCIVATVRRLRVVDDLGRGRMLIEPLDEPASQVTRVISDLTLTSARDPKGLVRMEIDAVTDEVMRVAVRRGPREDVTADLNRAVDEYRRKVAAAIGVPSSMLGETAATDASGTWCPACGQHDSVDDSGVCRKCGSVVHEGPPCRSCGSTRGWIAGRDTCPDCGWDGRCAACDFIGTLNEDLLCRRCAEADESSEISAGVTISPVRVGLQRCSICREPDSAAPGSPCPACMELMKQKDEANRPLVRPPASPATPPTITINDPPCRSCGGMKGWMPGRDKCPSCGWDGVTCRGCGHRGVVAGSDLCPACKRSLEHVAATRKRPAVTCSECNGTGLSAAGGLCPMCKDLLRKKEMDDFADLLTESPIAATRKDDPCPECGGTGEVQLFTSVQPCSRGCGR